LASIIKHNSVDWLVSEDLDSRQIMWLPIFTIEFDKDYKRTFGLTSDGYWLNHIVMGTDEKIHVCKEKSEYLGLITVLQKDRNEIEKLVRDGLDKYTIGEYSIEIFPFRNIIKFALQTFWFGGFWPDRALTWLRLEDFDEELCQITKKIITEKGLDQKGRHYLFKLMRRYEHNIASQQTSE
jgi:hypothetical protein